jgi:hypothetical protein
MEVANHPAQAIVAFTAPVKISQSRSNRGLFNPSRESIRRGNRTGKAEHAPTVVNDDGQHHDGFVETVPARPPPFSSAVVCPSQLH